MPMTWLAGAIVFAVIVLVLGVVYDLYIRPYK